MSKFIKRLKKSIGTAENALVIGTAFGHLDDIKQHFNTVFVHNDKGMIRSRNIVNIKNINDIGMSKAIHIIFFDLSYISDIEKIAEILTRQKPYLAIEGNNVVERSRVEYLYKTGYRAIEKLGEFHLWKKIK